MHAATYPVFARDMQEVEAELRYLQTIFKAQQAMAASAEAFGAHGAAAAGHTGAPEWRAWSGRETRHAVSSSFDGKVRDRCRRWTCPVGCVYVRHVAHARHSRVSLPLSMEIVLREESRTDCVLIKVER